ncbi:MAG: hypothetical protein SF028_12080 [Candidatus Sumerlaeia bacterium]|nr:hypothetical protein [Candidatus Sumerlaeia bacterium]
MRRALQLCAALLAGSVPAQEPPAGEEGWDRLRSTVAALRNNPMPKPRFLANPEIVNPGFEALTTAGLPAGWSQFRLAVFDTDPATAFEGSNSIRSQRLHGWYQDLVTPADPFQHAVVRGKAWSEFDFETVRIHFEHYSPLLQFIDWPTFDASVIMRTETGGWGDFWTLHRMPEGSSTAQLFPASRYSRTFVRYDNLELLREGAPPFDGERWALAGGAALEGGRLELAAGSSATATVVQGRLFERYFTLLRATSADGSEIVATATPLRRSSADADAPRSATATIPGGGVPTQRVLAFDPTPRNVSGLSELRIEALSGAAEIEALARGFLLVEPSEWTVGSTSPDDDLVVTAALPGLLTTGTLELVDAARGVARPLAAEALGTTLRARLPVAEAPGAGSWTIRARLEGTGFDPFTLEAPVAIVEAPAGTAAPPPFRLGDFPNGAFMWFLATDEPGYITRAIRAAKEDGFDFGMLIVRADQLAEVREAVDAESFPFLLSMDDITRLFSNRLYDDSFSSEWYTSEARALAAPVSGSPHFMGIYAVDEPFGDRAFRRLRRVQLAAAQDPVLKNAFAIHAPAYIDAADLSLIDSPVHIVDLYPYDSGIQMPDPDILFDFQDELEGYAAAAAAAGKDLWLTPQAFVSLEQQHIRAVKPSAIRAHLGAGLAAGIKGTLSFTWTSIFGREGIRDFDLERTSVAAPFVEFHKMTDRLGPLLQSLALPTRVAGVPRPLIASRTSDADGSYAWFVNADGDRSVAVEFTADSDWFAPPRDLVGGRVASGLGGGRWRIELPPGEFALVDFGEGGLLAVESVETDAGAQPCEFDLPVTHTVPVRAPFGSPTWPERIEYDTARRLVAVSALTDLDQIPPRVFELLDGGAVRQFTGPTRYAASQWFFANGGIVGTSTMTGLRFHSPAEFESAPTAEFYAFTGGALDALADGERWWVTTRELGLRRLSLGPEGFAREAAYLAPEGTFQDVFGPFADGAVLVAVEDFGLDYVPADSLSQEDHERLEIPRLKAWGDIEPGSRRLAFARRNRGAVVVDLAEDGRPLDYAPLAEELVDASAVAWLAPEVLAVADGVYAVHFYHVPPSGTVRHVGCWEPPPAANGFRYIRALAASDGTLVAGLQDGRALVVDASEVVRAALAPTGWRLE